MNFNIILGNLRTSHKLTQDDLAKILNVSKITIDMYESGVREPNYEILCAISDYFNVDIDFLLGHQAITNDAPDISSSAPISNRQAVAQNISYYMKINNKIQKDLMDDLDLNSATISSWVNGDIANMKRDKIVNLANALSVSPAVIMGWEQPATDTYPKGVVINVLGRVAAGIPIEAIEEIIDTEEISQEMASTGEFFGLKIHGDSMEPRMYEGDVVIVRKQEDADSGDIVIAMVNGDDATCKRLVKYENGINLLSLNSKYAPIVFSKEEIETKPVRIIGKVVELRGKF